MPAAGAEERRLLVYDFGGGTCDAAVVIVRGATLVRTDGDGGFVITAGNHAHRWRPR